MVRALNRYGRTVRRFRPDHGNLDAGALVEKAKESSKLDDFGDDGWKEGLGLLVDSINAEGNLSELGSKAMSAQIGAMLGLRLLI